MKNLQMYSIALLLFGFGFEAKAQVVPDNLPRVLSITRLSTSPSSEITSADQLSWRVTFDRDVKNVDAADFRVVFRNSVGSRLRNSALVVRRFANDIYDVIISGGNLATWNGTITLLFADSSQDILDTLNNPLRNSSPIGRNENSYMVDNIPPQIVSIVRQAPRIARMGTDSLAWRITFNEAMSGVVNTAFQISGPTVTSNNIVVTAVGDTSTVYDVTASGNALSTYTGRATLAIASGHTIRDSATLTGSVNSNWNLLVNPVPTGLNESSYELDNTRPTVTIGIPVTTNAEGVTATFTFSEAVTGFETDEITVGNGTAYSLVRNAAGNIWTARIIPDANGSVTVDVAAEVAVDLVGNLNEAAAQATTTATLTPAPRVASIRRLIPVGSRIASPTLSNTLRWEVNFNETVVNVTASDFELAGITATLAVTGSGAQYTVTASGGDLRRRPNGIVTLSFDADQDIENAFGDPLVDTTPTGLNQNSFELDNTPMTATIGNVPADSTGPFRATFTFSEPVGAFRLNEILVSNGVPSDLVALDAATYSALITPSSDGQVTIDLIGFGFRDLAGNGVFPAPTQAISNYDSSVTDGTEPQVISVHRLSSSPTNADTLQWQVNFNEGVTNVADADFEIAGTTATLAVTGSGTQYTVTASGGDLANLNGEATLSFASDQDIEDSAGNLLADTTPIGVHQNVYVIDNAAPLVASIVRHTPASSPTSADRLTWQITFNEAVSNVTSDDFEIAGTTALLAVTGSGGEYEVTAGSGGDLENLNGEVTLSFASGQDIEDSASNLLVDASPTGTNENNYLLENIRPTVAISGVPETVTGPFTATFTFSEQVRGFELADIHVARGRASEFKETSAGVVFTARITPTMDGLVVVNVPDDVAENLQGNGNTAAIQQGAANYDVAPRVTSIVRHTPAREATNMDTLTWLVTFSDDKVTNVDPSDFEISGTDATLTVTGTAPEYQVVATGGNLAELTERVTLSFAEIQDIEDGSGKVLADVKPTERDENTFKVDNTPPTLTIDVPENNLRVFTATFAFSEEVTGFTIEDISVINGTVSGFRAVTLGTIFTAQITPDSDGDDTTVDVATNVAMDLADNPNMKGTQVSSRHTIVAPDSMMRAQQAFLSRFGRTIGQQTVDAVTDRMKADRSPGLKSQLAGHALLNSIGGREGVSSISTISSNSGGSLDAFETSSQFLAGTETGIAENRASESGQVPADRIVSDTSFALTTEKGQGASLSLWGRGAYSNFEGEENNLNLEGEVTSFLIGADWKREHRLFGLMLSQSRGESDYHVSSDKGEIDAKLTALIPYLGWEWNQDVSGWAALGFGQGDMTISPTNNSPVTMDTYWQMISFGVNGQLGSAAFLGGAKLNWNSDFIWTRAGSEDEVALSAANGDSIRFRLGVESRWNYSAFGTQLSPHLELGARYDGGDAETGSGVEIGGGVDWLNPSHGLEVTLKGRMLALHEDGDFEDWGLAFNVAYDRDRQSKHGFRAELSHDFGGASSDGVAALLAPELFPETVESNAIGGLWSAEMAYGLRRGRSMIGSPYTRLSGDKAGFDRMRFGYRIEPDTLYAADMTLDLWMEPEMEKTKTDGTITGLELRRRW